MIQAGNTQNQSQQDEQESSIDLKKIVFNLFSYWHWYLISFVICAALAFSYLYFAIPKFKIHATLLVENAQSSNSSSSMLDESSLLTDLGLSNVANSVDNEMAILESHSLMEKIVRDLQLNVRYYGGVRIKSVEIPLTRCPFEFKIDSLSDIPANFPINFEVKLTGNGFIISNKESIFNIPFGEKLRFKGSVFQVAHKALLNPADTLLQSYSVTIISYEQAITNYLNNLSIINTNSKAATISLTLNEEPLPRRGIEMLNNLINTYTLLNIVDKNRVADSTITFINKRLFLVSDELNGIEKQIQGFKQANKLTDLTTQAQLLVTNTNDYLKNLAVQQTQLEIVTALDNYIKDEKTNKRVVPANLAIQTDPNFTNLLNIYNQLQLERERQVAFTTNDNPAVQTLDGQIARVRLDLISSVAQIKRNLVITIGNIKNNLSVFDRQINEVPATERQFLEYSRQQTIKQEIYIFLLKQREETEIGKTANLAPVRIVDPPYYEAVPYSPNKLLIYILFILTGIVLPTLIIYLKQALNTRVSTRKDVTDNTTAPILGEISQAAEDKKIVFAKESRSVIAEQFRILRTNLDFIITDKGDETRTIMITSSMSSEGKSFVAMNLATALSMSGKKVVLLEFDLRMPKVLSSLGVQKTQGLSNFIVNQMNVEEVLIPSGVHENFFLIGSGVIPPNPAELILNKRVNFLMTELKKRFDYIIFDTPPAGLVTDAQLLSKYADASIYIVRQGYTFRAQLNLLQDIIDSNKIKNLNVVINGVKIKNSYGYGYGYGYGQSKNYGYYGNSKDEKLPFYKRWFQKS